MKSILVTGSGSGIGAAIAGRLAASDCGIVLHANHNRSGCERVARQLQELGARTEIVLGDLADLQVGEALVETAVRRFGGLDVLIANAGFPVPKVFGEAGHADLDECYQVMTRGFFQMANCALEHLEKSTAGRVIAISTLNAHVFRPQYPVYPASAAAKAGLEALVRSLAIKLAPHNVTVNAVAPGLIRKDADTLQFYSDEERADLLRQVPLGRMGEPDEVAALAAFLAGPGGAYITGQVIHVNGGIA